jgi:putative heme-binding domain-containing protein
MIKTTGLRALSLALLVTGAPLLSNAQSTRSDENLPLLVEVLRDSRDAQFQLDMLRGISSALKGRRNVPMPTGWAEIETRLGESSNNEVRALTQSLSLTFGSSKALAALRQIMVDPKATATVRRSALDSLLGIKDPELPPLMQKLLQDETLRGAALRGLAGYDDAATPGAILGVYPQLNGGEKRDALNTLASRLTYATQLLTSVSSQKIPSKDLTADLVRQLRNLKNASIDEQVAKVWGVARESGADKKAEIEKYRRIYRAGGSTPGEASRGRAVFARTCQQCHTLFDTGGKVGPDLTGSARADLDYILQNMVDPNAVIPNEYRSSTIETKDERVITGIIKAQDEKAYTIATANELVVLPKGEVKFVQQSEISMMPEGLLAPLNEQEVRDLIYYLGRPGQVPLVATAETLGNFFNEKDLTGWDGDPALWHVENGEIVGKSATGLKQNEFLKSQMIFANFRLTCKVKLTPNKENSGIQIRSEPLPDGEVKGFQADVGAGWWGKIYEERGRGILWDKSGEAAVKPEDWNTYEVLAVGSKVRTAINGHLCADLDDPKGAAQGVIAFQLHAGGPLEVRYKDLKIELNPAVELKTLK